MEYYLLNKLTIVPIKYISDSNISITVQTCQSYPQGMSRHISLAPYELQLFIQTKSGGVTLTILTNIIGWVCEICC